MVIGDKIKEIRESKKLSQGDIEQRTGLLRCYTSRVVAWEFQSSFRTFAGWQLALKLGIVVFQSTDGAGNPIPINCFGSGPPKIHGSG